MSLTSAAIRLMGALGLTVDQIADVADANAAPVADSTAEKRRAYDRERKRKSTGIPPEDNSALSTGIPPETVPPSCTQVVTPSLPSLRSEELIGGGGGNAGALAIIPVDDWPAGNAETHAKLLVAATASPWLDPDKALGLPTTEGRLVAWRKAGASWALDVLPVVRALCASRGAKISSWKFFDQAIGRSVAENRAALEIPEAGSVIRLHATGPPRTIDEKSSAAWDFAMQRIAENE